MAKKKKQTPNPENPENFENTNEEVNEKNEVKEDLKLSQEVKQDIKEENEEDEEIKENPDTESDEELQALKEELEQKKDQFLRLSAEYDNYRKRTAAEKTDLRANACASLLTDLLPVLDNFDRALEHAEEGSVTEGITLIQKQLLDILQKAGLAETGKVGEAFDPNFHEAVMQEPAEDTEPNTILAVLQKGYTCNGKLLRAAMVKVSA